MNSVERDILRKLATEVAEISRLPVQDERRVLWKELHNLKAERPMVLVRWFGCAGEILPDSELQCRDPFARQLEARFRLMIFQHGIGDDNIIEPWFLLPPVYRYPSSRWNCWGVEMGRHESGQKGGAWKGEPPIVQEEDIEKLVMPHHEIDEEKTSLRLEQTAEVLDDIMPVYADRGCFFRGALSDLSTDLGHLRGIENIMWDMTDRQQWLHKLMSFLRDGVLACQEQAERAGHWKIFDGTNQSLLYSDELPCPDDHFDPVGRDKLWCFLAAQEFDQISPAMHEEFLLRYQIPIMEKFGLSAYGCCENLSAKIDMLRQIPNLRRIAVTPWADIEECARKIGTDYVYSWRPNPSDMGSYGFDPDKIKRIIKNGLEALRGCHTEICFKDISSLEGHPERLAGWVTIVRGVIDELYG